MFAIHGLAIMPGIKARLFLAMPRFKHSDGTYRDTAHPINPESRKYIEKCVFEAYDAGKAAKRV